MSKKVLIIGAARSGIAAAKFLVNQGAIVALNDRKPIEALGVVVTAVVFCFWPVAGRSAELVARSDRVGGG